MLHASTATASQHLAERRAVDRAERIYDGRHRPDAGRSYAPLAQGRAASDPTLASLGQKYGCSAAQMAVAWLLDQKGVIVIPKAARSESQKANLDALGTRLDDKDRAAIAALPKGQRLVRPPFAPEWDAIG